MKDQRMIYSLTICYKIIQTLQTEFCLHTLKPPSFIAYKWMKVKKRFTISIKESLYKKGIKV